MTTNRLQVQTVVHTLAERQFTNRNHSDEVVLDGIHLVASVPRGQGAAWVAEHGEAVVAEFDK